MTPKEQLDDIILDCPALSESLQFEVNHIKEETKDFTDEDTSLIWETNMKVLYKKIQQKCPEALRSYVPPVVEVEVSKEPEPSEAEKKALEIANSRKKVKA